MDKIVEKLAKLMEVKSIVTIAMTFILAYMIIGGVTVEPELLALYSTSYGAVMTYYFTKKEDKGE